MTLKSVIAGLLVGLSLAGAPAGAQDKRPTTFNVGEQSYHWDSPARYCLPTGNDAAVSQAIDAADKQNVTLLTAVPCEGDQPFRTLYPVQDAGGGPAGQPGAAANARVARRGVRKA